MKRLVEPIVAVLPAMLPSSMSEMPLTAILFPPVNGIFLLAITASVGKLEFKTHGVGADVAGIAVLGENVGADVGANVGTV